jgi:hypothetical protein
MRPPLARALVPAIFAMACADYGLNPEPNTVGDLAGELSVDPSQIGFGGVEPSSEATSVFTVTNVGNASVTLDGIRIEQSEAFTLWTEVADGVLEEGESTDVVVTYTPMSLQDDGRAVVYSNAENPVLAVDLDGQGLFPELTLSPQSLSMLSFEGEPVRADVVATNTGTATLDLHSFVVQGATWFSGEADVPVSIEPDDSVLLSITYTPEVEGENVDGTLWVASNDPAGNKLANLTGIWTPACLGLAEAFTMGLAQAQTDFSGNLIVENTSDVYAICIDAWYVYLSDETQDCGAGDPGFDPTSTYGVDGSVVLTPGETTDFGYGRTEYDAWWCMEQTQVTSPTTAFHFNGARVPTPLLNDMVKQNDNEAVWQFMNVNPVITVGRTQGQVSMANGDFAGIQIEVTNMGRVAGSATVFESIPPGFLASSFTQAPSGEGFADDGSVIWSFDVSLEAAVDTPEHEPTIYDTKTIGYQLERLDPTCLGRVFSDAPTADWTSSAGDGFTSSGSPLVIWCD